jgi:hypothetical protein
MLVCLALRRILRVLPARFSGILFYSFGGNDREGAPGAHLLATAQIL